MGDESDYYSDLDGRIDGTFYIGFDLAVGRIEICIDGVWNPVCQDFWTEADAAVTCHQLGFSRAGI